MFGWFRKQIPVKPANTFEIHMDRDFSGNEPTLMHRREAIGRTPNTSGESFRKLLVVALAHHDHVTVYLDGPPNGYGSSFLIGAFQELRTKENLSVEELCRRLTISCKSIYYDTYVHEATHYIQHGAG